MVLHQYEKFYEVAMAIGKPWTKVYNNNNSRLRNNFFDLLDG